MHLEAVRVEPEVALGVEVVKIPVHDHVFPSLGHRLVLQLRLIFRARGGVNGHFIEFNFKLDEVERLRKSNFNSELPS